MDLIDKNDGPLSHLGIFFRPLHDLLDLLDAAGHGRKVDEVGSGGLGDDAGQGRLADARRTPEDHGRDAVGFHHSS